MASIQNRSKYIVTVANRPDLTKRFPYGKVKAAKAYIAELQAQKFKPSVQQVNILIKSVTDSRDKTATHSRMKTAIVSHLKSTTHSRGKPAVAK